MSLQIKKYKVGDRKKILSLFEEVYDKKMSEEYWNWRYDNNLIGQKYIELMWNEDVLVGHYALFPIEIKVGNEIKKTGFSMTTMTSQRYQKQGVFNRLAKSLYDYSYNDLCLIWGFPNNNSLHGFIKYLNWKLIKDIPMLEVSVEGFKASEVEDNSLINIDSFSKDYDELFNIVSLNHKIMVKKDSNYLNWRYFNNPDIKYYFIEYRKNKQLCGFCAYKLYKNEKILNGYIVDILATGEYIFAKLINGAIEQLKSLNAKNIYIWMNDPRYLQILNEMNFRETNRITHFGCRLNSYEEFNIDICDYNNWYVMMGDSDVF